MIRNVAFSDIPDYRHGVYVRTVYMYIGNMNDCGLV